MKTLFSATLPPPAKQIIRVSNRVKARGDLMKKEVSERSHSSIQITGPETIGQSGGVKVIDNKAAKRTGTRGSGFLHSLIPQGAAVVASLLRSYPNDGLDIQMKWMAVCRQYDVQISCVH